MARRATWLLFMTFGSAASACSILTSWDDVRLGAIGDAATSDGATTIDSGTDAVVIEAGPPDADASGPCVPGSVICVDGTGTGGAPGPSLYACSDAGTLENPVACLHACVHPPSGDEYCSCNPGDTYCGGDNVVGDRGSLYQCGVNGPPTFKQRCSPLNCDVHPGSNDDCGP